MSKFNAVGSGMRGSQKPPAPADPVKATEADAKAAKKYDARSSGMRGNEPAPKEGSPAEETEAKPAAEAKEDKGTEVHPGIHKFSNGRIMINPAKFK